MKQAKTFGLFFILCHLTTNKPHPRRIAYAFGQALRVQFVRSKNFLLFPVKNHVNKKTSNRFSVACFYLINSFQHALQNNSVGVHKLGKVQVLFCQQQGVRSYGIPIL